MNKLSKKILTASLVASVMTVGTPAIFSGTLVQPLVTEVQAYSPIEALISGGAAMAYVTKALGEMDNTDKGQQESLERTKKQTGYYDNAAAQNRVQTIMNNLSRSPLVKRKYVVYVNPDDDFNAFMTIGRVMSINKGALDKLDDSELAYVMAHEISHGEHKDVVNGLKKQIGLSTAINVAAAGAGGGAILGNLVGSYINNQVFTMSQEQSADELGFKILADSQYNIGGAPASMAVLHKAYGDHYREGLAQVLAPNNHPKTSDRVTINNKRMYMYSKAHVYVQGSTVYVNGQSIYTPTDSGRYTGEERAYLMAGKLAKLYHNNAIAPDWASYYGSEVTVGSTSIVDTGSYSAAQSVAETLNKAFSTKNPTQGLVEDSDKNMSKAERKKAFTEAKIQEGQQFKTEKESQKINQTSSQTNKDNQIITGEPIKL